jgi:biopolymer transport protein ExbB/TolQ
MTFFINFVRENFWHVLPLLIAGAFAVAIIIERTRALMNKYPMKDTESFFERIGDLVLKGKMAEAVAVCDRFQDKPAAQVTKQALLRAHQPENLIESAIGITVGKTMGAIQGRTSFLATIANVATLLGLLGTIVGLVSSFSGVGNVDPAQKSAMLAAGISTAMNATILGLAVAIPCMVAFSFLISKTNKIVAEVDSAAMRTMDLLRQRFYAVENDTVAQLERIV